MASRELRLLKLEADALRRELNEWRDRANLHRVEEPVRSEAFSMVLSGEVEILTSIPGMEEEDDGEGLGDNDDDLSMGTVPGPEDVDSMGAPTVKTATNPFPHMTPQHLSAPHLTHILPRPATHSRPIIAQSVSNVSFENPAMASLYDQQAHIPSQQYQIQLNVGAPLESDKPVAWNDQIFPPQLQQQLANQQGLFTPPTASHASLPNNACQQFTQQAYCHGPPRQQHPAQHLYGSPVDSEDASSIGSGPGFGGRDCSYSGSAYSSPQDTRASSVSSQPGSYEMPGILTSGGIPPRMSAGGAMWNRNKMDTLNNSNMIPAPIAVGTGGGNGGGFTMVM